MENGTILDGAADQNGAVNETKPVIGGEVQQTQQAQQQEAAFDYAKMVGANGELADNWREALPENLRNEKCLDSIKTVQTLAQSYVHSQHAIGQNKVALPGENATPEEWSAFYKACGRPENQEEYKHDGVKIPEGIVLDEEQVKVFQKFAFEHGFNQKTFEAALAFDVQRVQNQIAAAQAAADKEYNETLGKLRSEYGGNFESVIAQCNKAMQTFGLVDVMREKGLLNNYTLIKALAGIGERIGESKLKGNDGTPVAVSPQSRLDEIRLNPEDPYYKKEHPAHNARVAEVNNLLAALARSK